MTLSYSRASSWRSRLSRLLSSSSCLNSSSNSCLRSTAPSWPKEYLGQFSAAHHFHCFGCFTSPVHRPPQKKGPSVTIRSPLGKADRAKRPNRGSDWADQGEAQIPSQALRRTDWPLAIGAGLPAGGCIFASFTSSFSTLRCSLGRGRLASFMAGLLHPLPGVAIGCCI